MDVEDRSRFVFCDNIDRDSGTAAQFTFNFCDRQMSCGEDEVITMELFDFFCQHSVGGINSDNNKFLWNDTLIEIPPGSYTGPTLASTLQTEINAQLTARAKTITGTGVVSGPMKSPAGIGYPTPIGENENDFALWGPAPGYSDYAAGKVSVTYHENLYNDITKTSGPKLKILVPAPTSQDNLTSGQLYFQDTGSTDLTYPVQLTFDYDGELIKLILKTKTLSASGGWELSELNNGAATLMGFHSYSLQVVANNNYLLFNTAINSNELASSINISRYNINISHTCSAIDLHTDIPNDNLESTQSKETTFQPSTRFARIPVLVPPGAFIYYHCGGSKEQRLIFPQKYVNTITFKITNNLGQLLFIGGHVQFTLIFKTVKKAVLKHDEHHMFSQMIDQLKEIATINKMDFISKKGLE